MNAGTIFLVEINYIVILFFLSFLFKSQEKNLGCLSLVEKQSLKKPFSQEGQSFPAALHMVQETQTWASVTMVPQSLSVHKQFFKTVKW